MIKKLRVAVDQGNRNMKTCNHVFTTGLTEMDKKPARGEHRSALQADMLTHIDPTLLTPHPQQCL